FLPPYSHEAMAQEAGRRAWPTQAEGYQTITVRRRERRHNYVSFRPSLNSQDRDEHQHNEACDRLDLEDVQEENSLCSNLLVQVSSGLLDEPLLENTRTGEPICQSISRQTSEANTSQSSLFTYGLEGNQISWNFMNPNEKSEDLAEYSSGGRNDLNGQSGIASVNVDSCEPDSSDREEGDAQDKLPLPREEAGVFQQRLDNMLSELEEGIESSTDLESRLSALNRSVSRKGCEGAGPMPLMTYFGMDSNLTCPNNRTFKSSAEDQAIPKSNPNDTNCETPQTKNTVDVAMRTPQAIANELNGSDGKTDQGNSAECVVRPKTRKESTAKQWKLFSSDDDDDSDFWKRFEIAEGQQGHGGRDVRNSDEVHCMFFDSECEANQQNTETDQRENAANKERTVSELWNEFEEWSRNFSALHRDQDSSESSDECFTDVHNYFTDKEKDCVTGPGRQEGGPEVLSSSRGVERSTDFSLQGREQAFPHLPLEEGEIPWLQYRGRVESSDEDNEPVSESLNPGFFPLDRNNLEDDSSVSEELHVDWRRHDEFGGAVGHARVFPNVSPQVLTFTALEEHLQQAMESALTYLESIGFGVEQAHPPATKETIDRLPQIIVTNDHDGQEQRCTICCSEYVRGEIITKLPCHHLFHKLCVTLWLQESGTCPVCRHVLAPVLPQAAAATVSFLTNHDSASSV
ncbi:E3 ubiquitin-protein ligase Praja-2, partial [Tyto alba]